jgi:hypothetical protein
MKAAFSPGSTFAGYRIEDGRLRFETAITPPAELLARR